MNTNRTPNEPQNYTAVLVGVAIAIVAVLFLVWMYNWSTTTNTTAMGSASAPPNSAISTDTAPTGVAPATQPAR